MSDLSKFAIIGKMWCIFIGGNRRRQSTLNNRALAYRALPDQQSNADFRRHCRNEENDREDCNKPGQEVTMRNYVLIVTRRDSAVFSILREN